MWQAGEKRPRGRGSADGGQDEAAILLRLGLGQPGFRRRGPRQIWVCQLLPVELDGLAPERDGLGEDIRVGRCACSLELLDLRVCGLDDVGHQVIQSLV